MANCVESSSGPFPFDQINESMFYDIEGQYAIGGVGLRNKTALESLAGVDFIVSDPNITKLSLTFTMRIRQAWLYWNSIQKDVPTIYNTSIDFRESPSGYTTVAGTCIGKCGNTCWTAYGQGETDPEPGVPLVNYVFRADVTSLLSTSTAQYMMHLGKVYSVRNFQVSTSAATSAELKLPSSVATQGAVLLIIFDWVAGPSTQGYPREKDFWKIRVFDGAKLVSPECSPHHQITHSTSCLGCPNFVFAVGDAQRFWSDMVYINGVRGTDLPNHPQNTPLPPAALGVTRDQVFWQNVGPGMGIQLYVAPIPDTTITIDMLTNADCLVWFLYVHAAHCCNCRVKVRLTATGAGLNVSGTKTISLGAQYVDAVVIVDNCDCLDDTHPVLIKVNDEADFSVIPDGGRLVALNDLIDIKLNTTKCSICEQWGPFCATSSSSGGAAIIGSQSPGEG